MFPAGHYYSPIPSKEDILNHLKSKKIPENYLLGINLNTKEQSHELAEYIKFYEELKFPEKQTSGNRYYYENNWFSYSDAIFFYSFLRKYMPKRIIEIGSGFSTAVMLDTIDSFFPQRPKITLIEPYPSRLNSLLIDRDYGQIRLIEKKVQEVPYDDLLTLESGDLLFIDSSHVVKCGSDLQFLIFEILPQLKPGVFIHFHDVFLPI
jgi:predicted O-methyltransferase YrrM